MNSNEMNEFTNLFVKYCQYRISLESCGNSCMDCPIQKAYEEIARFEKTQPKQEDEDNDFMKDDDNYFIDIKL